MRRTIGEPCRWQYEDGEFLLEAASAVANPIGKVYKRLVNGSEVKRQCRGGCEYC